MLSDELADAALPIFTGPDGQDGGTDLLTRLEAAAEREFADAAAKMLWQQLQKVPTNLFGRAGNRSIAGRPCFGATRHRFWLLCCISASPAVSPRHACLGS
jgi:hypothetical protein